MTHAHPIWRAIARAVLAGSWLWAAPAIANPAPTQRACSPRSTQLLAQFNSDITGTNINQGPPSVPLPSPPPGTPTPPPAYSGPPPSQISQQLQQTLQAYQQAETRALNQPRRFSRSRRIEECINPFAEQLESLLESGQTAVEILSEETPSPAPTGGDAGSGSRLW